MKFLVVGDAMIDRYWIGRVERLNPEKHSAPLLRVIEKKDCPGGALNVLKNVQALGAKNSCHVDHLHSGQKERLLPIKNRLMDEQDGVIARWDEETVAHSHDIETIKKFGPSYDAVIISDYCKGSINTEVVNAVCSLGKPLFVDTKGDPSPWLFGNTIAVFPNKQEYNQYSKEYAAFDLCMVTLGELGAEVLRRGASVWQRFPSVARTVRNVTGAGDTVVAAWATAYMALKDSKQTLSFVENVTAFSMWAAAAAVSAPLTAAPTWSAIETIKGGLSGVDWMIKEDITNGM